MKEQNRRVKRARRWSAEQVLELGRNYQGAAVLAAGAELEVFTPLVKGARTARELAPLLKADFRGLVILLDALTALGLVKKRGDRYSLGDAVDALLTPSSAHSVLAMAQHQANCLRNWAQLAQVVKSGRPAARRPSVRGQSGDKESFIGAMHNISWPHARKVISAIKPLKFKQVLDIGGGSGTWTMAFLEDCPGGRATIFDLPHVIKMAKRRLANTRFADRVRLVAGDFYRDPLPSGSDLAWVSAIVHQNSRVENRRLFRSVFRALVPGGRIAIRDIVMEPNHAAPAAGALFAVNMLVATRGGGTFTLKELSQDLKAAGFSRPKLARRDPGMNCVLVAEKQR